MSKLLEQLISVNEHYNLGLGRMHLVALEDYLDGPGGTRGYLDGESVHSANVCLMLLSVMRFRQQEGNDQAEMWASIVDTVLTGVDRDSGDRMF